jgi:hypothetical protein
MCQSGGTGVRENANLCTPWCWGSVGLSAQGPHPPSGRGRRSILLPTKTSLLVSQLFGQMFGRSALNDRIGSQVDITHLVDV